MLCKRHTIPRRTYAHSPSAAWKLNKGEPTTIENQSDAGEWAAEFTKNDESWRMRAVVVVIKETEKDVCFWQLKSGGQSATDNSFH